MVQARFGPNTCINLSQKSCWNSDVGNSSPVKTGSKSNYIQQDTSSNRYNRLVASQKAKIAQFLNYFQSSIHRLILLFNWHYHDVVLHSMMCKVCFHFLAIHRPYILVYSKKPSEGSRGVNKSFYQSPILDVKKTRRLLNEKLYREGRPYYPPLLICLLLVLSDKPIRTSTFAIFGVLRLGRTSRNEGFIVNPCVLAKRNRELLRANLRLEGVTSNAAITKRKQPVADVSTQTT
mmetsp:Transcript_29950/g.50267  ORF Transcript_29950/g.50267 Transcript_29950/m.50267 type:complete len:234 (+) Transcript_29950:1477-2178(+)